MQFLGGFPSRDGKKIFAYGLLGLGELVRYDATTKHFDPYLGGISANMLHFSKNREWVTYVTYPEGSLWRSKTDGSQRLQLTFPPTFTFVPHWSPDRQWIAFTGCDAKKTCKIYIISAEGGIPQQLMPGGWTELDPMWFPDGKRLLFNHAAFWFDTATSEIQWIDLETKAISTVPGSKGFCCSSLSPNGRYITATPITSKDKVPPLLLFDFETQTWSKLVEGTQVNNRSWSKDSKYFYFLNFPEKPKVYRVRIADRKLEEVASVADFQVTGTPTPWFGLTPDDSPLVVRDLSSQEIYALDLEAP